MRSSTLGAMLVLAIAATGSACGGDDDGPATCEELAAIVADCEGGGLAEVEFIANVCDRVVLSGDCLREWGTADCAEQAEPEPSFADTCFPACDPADAPSCQGDDALRICDEDGVQVVFRCQAVCAGEDLTFAGACSDEFEGTPSPSGGDVCWCE